MSVIPNIVVNALVLSSVYILASLGFAFIFNMLGSVNLAHGAFYMLAAYITYYLCAKAGMNNWLAMLLAAVVLAAIGVGMERCVFRPFQKEFDRVVMVSVALMTMLQQLAVQVSGSQTISIPAYASGFLNLGFMLLTSEKLVTILAGGRDGGADQRPDGDPRPIRRQRTQGLPESQERRDRRASA